jgi:hemin uptake protein HemP
MTQVYLGIVRRAGIAGGGEFALVDWEAKTLRAKSAVSPTAANELDPNPRGGARGGRGMWVTDTFVYAVSETRITVFDHELREVRFVSNDLLRGAHEVFMEHPGALWVASTHFDAAVEFDLSSGERIRSYRPCDNPRLQKALGLAAPPPGDMIGQARSRVGIQLESAAEGHLHLNAVATWNGELHALLAKVGVIVNLERGEVVVTDDMLHHGHNLVVSGDHLFTTSTKHRAISEFELPTGRLVRSLKLREFDWVRSLEAKAMRRRGLLRRSPDPRVAKPLFARGLQVLGDTVYVGLSPASILKIDWSRGELLDTYQYSRDVYQAVHGLQVVPDSRAAA